MIEKTVSTEGDFPSLEDFDLSARDGILQDVALLEKTVLETSRKLNGEREYPDGLPFVYSFLEAACRYFGKKGDHMLCAKGKTRHQVQKR